MLKRLGRCAPSHASSFHLEPHGAPERGWVEVRQREFTAQVDVAVTVVAAVFGVLFGWIDYTLVGALRGLRGRA